MLFVKTIKPKMLSSFISLDSVINGTVFFQEKQISINNFISLFCFVRSKKILNLKFKLKIRFERNPKISIDNDEFKDFKICVEELNYMNKQYILFKVKNQINKSKTQKFYKFYKEKLFKKNQENENLNSKKSLSISSNDEVNIILKHPELSDIANKLLPEIIPDSIKISCKNLSEKNIEINKIKKQNVKNFFISLNFKILYKINL